jgi:hypothetical protein
MTLSEEQIHLLSQPLNVIRLVQGNMLNKIMTDGEISNREYYILKLKLIEDQVNILIKEIREI